MNEERAAIKQEIDFKKKEEKDTIKKKIRRRKTYKIGRISKENCNERIKERRI